MARRNLLSDAERQALSTAIVDTLRRELPPDQSGVGFYWPLQGEIDLRPLMEELVSNGVRAALPVIVDKGKPLEFWEWRPGMRLCSDGVWGIPTPTERKLVALSALLVPLLGFDAAGHRLGYGGGYYDRSLAVIDPRPLTVGIACEFGRLSTIYPQGHDVPMDAVVSERGIEWHREPPRRRE